MSGPASAWSVGFVARHRRREAEQVRERAAMVGVDGGVDAHAGLQLADEFVVLVEIDPHRNALHHLDEIPGRILRRQDRKLRAGAGRERTDRALEYMVGECVDVERDALADRDIGEIGFLRIGIDQGFDTSMTENTGAPDITKRPSWICSTCVATPFIGARTVVRSRLRWASSSAALACM